MGGYAPGPFHGRTGGAVGDFGDGPQPRGRPVLPISLIPLLAGERGQDLGPGRGVLGFGLLQPDQRLRLRAGPQLRGITRVQVPQPGTHHAQGLRRARRHSRLYKGAHGRDHLPGPVGGAARTPRARDSISSSILVRGSDKTGPGKVPQKRKSGETTGRTRRPIPAGPYPPASHSSPARRTLFNHVENRISDQPWLILRDGVAAVGRNDVPAHGPPRPDQPAARSSGHGTAVASRGRR